MNFQQSTQQPVQTGQPIYLSTDSSQKLVQIGNQSQNVLYTSQQMVQSNPNGYYVIQPQQSSSQTATSNTAPSTSHSQPKSANSQQPIVVQGQKAQQNSPRIIIQQPSSGQMVLPQQTGQNGQIFLNINNRIVPVQSVNVKQNYQNAAQSQSSPQFVILSNPSASNGQNTSLAGEITEKMKQLEQIQSQLKQYQQKILQSTGQGQQQVSTIQIQAVLSSDEQLQLQKLIASKKSVEGEIQQLKQKLMNQSNGGQTQSQSKLQLLQQVTQKLNALRSSKTVTVDSNTGQQQLVLTHEEFDQMKKLIDLQSSLQNELKGEQKPSTQTPQPQITTTINLNELNLNEKLKLNDLIKNQIEQIKQTIASQSNKDALSQLKEKYILLIKKQAELQSLIDKEKESGARQTPVKIRNVISQSQMIKSPMATPLRTLVINNKDNTATTSSLNASPSLSIGPLITLQQAVNLKKQSFADLEFKCLNFEELAQNGVITKETSQLTINLLKQLDERISQVINREQLESFQKNQVKLVKKYLEQQHLAKQNIKNCISEQLAKDQKLATEPDFKTPFSDRTDAIKRLSRYHVFQKTYFEPSQEDSQKFDECFEQVSDRLLRIADAMKKRFNLLQLRSMQKEVSSSEETLLLKLYVDDLKQDVDNQKQEIKEKQQEQKSQIQTKPLIQVVKTESPQTIRNLIKMNQGPSEASQSQSSFCLKRVLKCDDEDKSPKFQKTDSTSLISTDKSESNTSVNQLSSSAYPSSSSSSFNLKLETKPLNGDFDETFTNTNLDDFDNDNSNDDSNDFEQYETFRPLNSNQNVLDINEENSSSGLNTLANFDDFIINEDDLPMSSILDF